MRQWTIAAGPAATLLALGDPENPIPTLIQNVDPLNTVYLGNDSGISATYPLTCAPLPAGQSTVSNGNLDVYGIAAPGQTVSVNTYRGVSSFFLPASLSSIGGTTVFVQSTTPSIPAGTTLPINSLWFDTSNNSMKVWTGTAWVTQQFSGSQLIVAATVLSAQIANQAVTTAKIANGAVTAATVANGTLTTTQIAAAAGILGAQIANATITSGNIAANTIVAANIAANTITAAQLAAGIVYAGIVDATTVQAAQYIATGTQGQFLAYSGVPAAGNLVTAIAGMAGTDTHTNNFPQGLLSEQLTLVNQASAPPAFAGSSSFYSSTANRPRYVNALGYDTVLERNQINVASFAIGNNVSPGVPISGPLNFLANDSAQSSEFEIEISGFGTWGTTLNGLIFQWYQDGTFMGVSNTAGQFTIGVSGQTASQTFGYKVRYTMTDQGANQVTITADGCLYTQAANRIPSNSVSIGCVSQNVAWNPGINHTFQIYAWWNAAASGQAATTARTQIGRRMLWSG